MFKTVITKEESNNRESLMNALKDEYVALSNKAFKRGVLIDLLKLSSFEYEEAKYIVDTAISLYGLSSLELNSTLFKSFKDVEEATDLELYTVQALNYISTYGVLPISFEDLKAYEPKDIPKELLQDSNPLDKVLTEIKFANKSEVERRIKELLSSGIALKESDVSDIVNLVVELKVELDLNNVKNKEAMCLLSDELGVYPSNPSEIVRYLIYRMTGSPLLIKSGGVIDIIKNKTREDRVVVDVVKNTDRVKLSSVFNRFKPIFLAIKKSHPSLKSEINHISKLSKDNHKPMYQDVMSNLVHGDFAVQEIDSAIEKANMYQLVKATNALFLALERAEYGKSLDVTYQIRNGKSFTVNKDFSKYSSDKFMNRTFARANYLLDAIGERFKDNVGDKKILMTKGVDLALPTTLKTSSSVLPQYSTLDADSKNLLIGITWEKDVDIDLSCTMAHTSVSWFTNQRVDGVMHSGDMTRTNQYNIATEFILNTRENKGDMLISENLYSSLYNEDVAVDYKLIIGSRGKSKFDRNDSGIADIGDIKFTANMKSDKRSKAIGLYEAETDKFIILSSTLRGLNPSMIDHEKTSATMESMKMSAKSAIMVSDLMSANAIQCVYDESEIDGKDFIDLRLENLTNDSLSAIMK